MAQKSEAVNWNDKESVSKYLTGPNKDNKAIEGNDKFPETCANPPPFTMGDVFSKAEDLAKTMGGGEKCVKTSKTLAEQDSKSGGKTSNWHSETAANLDTFLVKANASHKMGGANTETNQESRSRMSSDNNQSGCGSLLITANNVAFKQSQMQCSITNNKDTKEVNVESNATVRIVSSPHTPDDRKTILQMKEELRKFATTNNENIQALTVTLTKTMFEEMRSNNEMLAKNPNSGLKEMTRMEILKLVNGLVQPMQKFLLEQMKLMTNALNVFQERKINIQNSQIIVKAGSKVKTFEKYDDETQTKLDTISNSIQKDVAAQQIANEMGTSAMDPNVKSMAQTSVDNQSSSSATAMKNTVRSSKLSQRSAAEFILECPGVITLIDTKLDISAINTLISDTVVKQAVANGQAASAQMASDSQKGASIQNKVAGMDKLQEKLGSSIEGAIRAGNEPLNKTIEADVAKTKEREQSFRAALPGGSNTTMIIIGVVVLVALYLLFGGGGGGGGGGSPIIIQSKMRPFRFQFKK